MWQRGALIARGKPQSLDFKRIFWRLTGAHRPPGQLWVASLPVATRRRLAYSSAMSHVEWEFQAREDTPVTVLPDGCRDVLILSAPGRKAQTLLTEWDTGPRQVLVARGTSIRAYRLRPGTLLSEDALSAISAAPEEAGPALQDADERASEIASLISLLAAPFASLDSAARQAGVSGRTLQRHFRTLKLPPPDFWRQLGRARAAAMVLATPTPVAEVAAMAGYSDQAHMTRAFGRWFGMSPARLRQDTALLAVLHQPGLGNWTGEQISTT